MGLQWVVEAVAGRREAFDRLVEHYSGTVLGLAYSFTGDMETARDIAQETFVKAWRSLGTLQRPDRFGSWLRMICANLARGHLRKGAPALPLEEAQAAGEETLEEVLAHAHLKEEVLRGLRSVPEAAREALVLHYLIGLSPAEAAGRLGISRAAFDTRLSRGRELLRGELLVLVDEKLHEQQKRVAAYLGAISAKVRTLLAARANLPRLRADLRSHDLQVRLRAAVLLGDVADYRAAPDLQQALTDEEEPPVQAELCRALARVGVREGDSEGYVRRAAAEALGALLGRLGAAQRRRAVEALCGALGDGDPGVQAEAAWSLRLAPKDLHPLVRERLFHHLGAMLAKRPGPWWVTVPQLLEAVGDEAAVRSVIERLQAEPDLVHEGPLAESLRRMARPGMGAALPLMELMRAGGAQVEGLWALGKLRDPGAVPFLQAALGSAGAFPVRTQRRLSAEQSQARVWEYAAKGLSEYPGAAELVKPVVRDWLAAPEIAVAPLLAAVQMLDDASLLEQIADHPRVPPRVQLAAKAGIRRALSGR